MIPINRNIIFGKKRIIFSFYFCFILGISLLLFNACNKKTPPQLPSNKPEVDSVAIALLETNQRLSLMAHKELTNYVLESGKPFVEDRGGYWYLIGNRKEGELLSTEQTYTIHQRIYLLDGTLCEDAIFSCQIGKKQFVQAVEYALPLLKIGENVVVLAPWYLAYGQQGNIKLNIGAYTNLKIEIEVMDN